MEELQRLFFMGQDKFRSSCERPTLEDVVEAAFLYLAGQNKLLMCILGNIVLLVTSIFKKRCQNNVQSVYGMWIDMLSTY